ncbi:MAG: dihydroorotate dehydrogenase [Phycisphaerae bacterium]|nr:dihydroorotate dehydrogenase [Phycisphaerae bacterium]
MQSGTLTTDLAGVELRNPMVLAAGTCGYLDELADAADLSGVGAVVTKSITPLPREGNPTWRILDSRCGMLNAIGLANVGLDHFIEHVGPRIAGFTQRTGTRVVGSVAGFSVEDYVLVAGGLAGVEGIAAVEMNVSCPNVRGGVEFGLDPGALREVVSAVAPGLGGKPLIVKLGPVVAGPAGGTIADLARAAIQSGARALCVANTVPAMAIDVRTRRPRLANTTGGLSGPGIHPIAVRLVYEVHRRVAREAGVPLVGLGGVMTWEDAAEMILAGASAVGMGTALFADPRAPLRAARGLARWVESQGRSSVGELVGAVEVE